MKTYIFQRKDGWYPLSLKDEKDAVANAECNPGTVKVTDAKTRKQIWPKEEQAITE